MKPTRGQTVKPMSPWIASFMGDVAKHQGAAVDEWADDRGRHAGDAVVPLLQEHPGATDEELVELALPTLDFPWIDLVEAEESRFYARVNDVVESIGVFGLTLEDEHYFHLDVTHDELKVHCRAVGVSYDSEDDRNHDRALGAAFYRTGAVGGVGSEVVDDGFGGEAVAFLMDFRWRYDGRALSRRYGAGAFGRAVRGRLREWREGAAQDSLERASAQRAQRPAGRARARKG